MFWPVLSFSGDFPGDRFTVTGPVPSPAIPTTLHGSLLARLDHLPATREVVQVGAALGRQFSHELISAVADMPQKQLNDALAQLVRAELIFQRGTPPDVEYIFKHALVQDAAYSTLLRGRRQQIHARIAATLESQFQDIVAAQPQLIAHHCAEAGLDDKAVGYQLEAGQQAVARSAMTEAAAQLQKGLDRLAGLPESPGRSQQELDLQIARGRALMATGGIRRLLWPTPSLGRERSLSGLIDLTILFHYCTPNTRRTRSEPSTRWPCPWPSKWSNSARRTMMKPRCCWVVSYTEPAASISGNLLRPATASSSVMA